MFRKIVLFTISALAVLLMLAACDTGDGTAGPIDFTFTSYPMDVPEDVTITWFTFQEFGMDPTLASWRDSPFLIGLNEQLGVNIEWVFPVAGADPVAGFQLLIAAGDLPDIIHGAHIAMDAERLIDEGVIRDLTPWMQYAPNYHAFLHDNIARLRAFRTDSGRYYGFGFFREDGGWAASFQGPLVRQDWLDQLGLPVPTTIGCWDYTLRAFHDEFNGATLQIPWGRFNGPGFLAGAFGAFASTGYRLFLCPQTDTIQLAQVLPEWRDYITHMNMWWNEGLIDQDLLTATDATVRTNMLNNEGGLSFSAQSQITLWTLDAEELNTGAVWVAAPFPTGNDGTLTMVYGGPGIIPGSTSSITHSVSDDRMEIAMRILDFAFSPEGFLYWNFGTEGVSWNMVNGEPVFSDLLRNDPDGIAHSMLQHVGTVWHAPGIQATQVVVQRNHPAAIAATNLWWETTGHIAVQYPLPPGMFLNAAEASRAEELRSPIQTHVNEMTVRFLTGGEPIENFDSFVATIHAE